LTVRYVRRLGYLLLVLLVLSGMVWGDSYTLATASPAPAFEEYQVKATFLYNFAKFVEWPKDSDEYNGSTFVIGILGKDPFENHLERVVKGKTIHGKQIVIKRWRTWSDVEGCQMLFVCPSEKSSIPELLEKLNGKPVLTVSDIKDFAEAGGHVGFFTEEDRVRFEINQGSAEEVDLKLSSQLLKVAKIVKTKKD
jgi:hypothetical protein